MGISATSARQRDLFPAGRAGSWALQLRAAALLGAGHATAVPAMPPSHWKGAVHLLGEGEQEESSPGTQPKGR